MASSGNRLLLLGCAAAGLALNGWIAFANRDTWDVDFNQYYSAGKLVGTGRLYDRDAIVALQLERNPRAVPFGRIPAFAVAFKPLSALPWPVARGIWFFLSVAALVGFVLLWPFENRAWASMAVCWSAPIAMCLAFGQDSILFLFFVSLGLSLLIARRDFLAGLAFSACIAKPHLALLVPVFLLTRREWRALLGGVIGVSVGMVVSFAVEGKDWIQRLLTLSRIPEFDPAAERMPNLRGLLSFFGGNFAIEVGLALAVAVGVFLLSRREPLPTIGALVLAGGLLIGHHAYFYDALLFLPALLLPFQLSAPAWLRFWALFLTTPLPYLLLLTNAGLAGNLAIAGYVFVLIAVLMIPRAADETGPENRLLRQY
jgi:hypothetical protein